MRTIYVLRGLPACGKSSHAAKMVQDNPKGVIRVNRDDLRLMVVGPGNSPHVRDDAREKLVTNAKLAITRQALKDGYDVVLDDTHLVSSAVKKVHELAESIGNVTVIEKCFNVPLAECISRDAKRTGFAHCGEKIITAMARSAGLDTGRLLEDRETVYGTPTATAGVTEDDGTPLAQGANLPKAIICDLDGTLSLLNGRSPYDASHCDRDLPNTPVIETVKALWLAGYSIIFTSGREDKHREPTERFIAQHLQVDVGRWLPAQSGLPVKVPDIVTIPHELFMRPTGDMRKDAVIKREIFFNKIFGKWRVELCLDDRDQVVVNWRQMGLTCFQVAEGNFL